MKEVKIEIPEGYEIDKDNSTFERIVFKEIKKVLTYNDVARELFSDKISHWINSRGTIYIQNFCTSINDPNNSTSKQQLESILALNKLCNVAKYLNGDWVPNTTIVDKYFIQLTSFNYTVTITSITGFYGGIVYFKTRELAEQALNILGEEEIKKALTLNY